MTEQRVQVVGPYGERGTVPLSQVDAVVKAGGRPATDQEVAQIRLDEEYAKKSTAEKVTGIAGNVGAALTGNVLALGGATGAHPALDAYNQGVTSGLSAGTYEGLVRKAVTELAGAKAGAAYEQHSRDLATGYSGAKLTGEMAGMFGSAALGSAGGAARFAGPGALISSAGTAVEQGAGRLLGGMAARGALGRAGATAIQLGAQGAVEGALYGAGQQLGENMLGNVDDVSDKVFAATGMGALYGALGGAVIGGAGSLAKSGVKAAAEGIGGGIARMGRSGEATVGKTALREAVDRGVAVEAVEAERAAAKAATSDVATSLSSRATRTLTDAADSLAFDALGTTRKIGDKINAKVKGGSNSVGRFMRDEILNTAEGGITAQRLMTGGRADELLPLISAKRAAKGQAIGEVVAGTPTRVNVSDVMADADAIYKKMLADPTQIQGAEAFRARVAQTFEAFGHGGKIADDGTMALSELYYGRAKLEGVAHEVGRKTAAEASVKEWLRNLDEHLVNKLDEAANSMGKSGEKEKLLGLKRDYQLASWAEKAAEDGANRIASNNIFGLREGIAAGVGFATAVGSDDPMLGVLGAGATALGGRFFRQRGAAAGALLLSRMAEMGAIKGAMQAVEVQASKSAKALLTPAKAEATAAAKPPRDPIAAARRAERQLTDLASRPEAVTERAQTITQGLSTTAPNVAGKVAANMTRALAFLNSKLPPNPQVDPLAPARPRTWTHTQAEKFSRYVEAAENPMGVLKDFERGKVTPEAVETLKVLTPTLYRELQVKTLDAIAQQLATGKPVTFEARIRMGTLLGIAADPSQDPKVRKFLQGNVQGAVQAAGGSMHPAPGPAPKPIQIKTQYSAFDRLAEGGPGRR